MEPNLKEASIDLLGHVIIKVLLRKTVGKVKISQNCSARIYTTGFGYYCCVKKWSRK